MQVEGIGEVEERKRDWFASYAYKYRRPKWNMDLLKIPNNKAWEYVPSIDTNVWCRYKFRPDSKIDFVVNNILESFNN